MVSSARQSFPICRRDGRKRPLSMSDTVEGCISATLASFDCDHPSSFRLFFIVCAVICSLFFHVHVHEHIITATTCFVVIVVVFFPATCASG